ncbi:hypothetical protein A3A93_06620 [Candidatus Roizmanbacteria bacterium RIFCSPLOWO2_01_FULL_38_12]|uniref:HEPN domain-containing protein n=1 Tax=Candidatus Roizmanbacteria bacterium RIFCSPLOWO2_01_FULL_38_12 TaxID=1802061 RepID=A0A1F7IXP3_9BACT|nr:MAG: hypothetical protein A2861_02625 [Candidatus Roizmanbacteria bacterium RIFCSPHIGHO2_01_FULL_38_15]OGK34283.1 MAG: hypothetical protein A3F59_05655 [Candidatus Roizmanbacteria bacterium RIFCSPHIGHO2_12_FULL_38_13]OGK48117.1 MAG: hypothetical protein A3A93_06620 [Candidatus Roizmanbacteria bacterium RIFCSPLOWO2_01_FULL_38_12]
MANGSDLRDISKARLKSVKILMDSKDWHGAAYMLAYALECALKAVTCKTLDLLAYPVNTKYKNIDSYFMTHRFEQLLIVSGLESTFSSRGPSQAWKNWSDFTIEYPGDWPSMRYDAKTIWDATKVKRLYNNLTEPQYGIITIIKRRRKW